MNLIAWPYMHAQVNVYNGIKLVVYVAPETSQGPKKGPLLQSASSAMLHILSILIQ